MDEHKEKNQKTVQCVKCERTTLKHAAYEKDGQYYCCPDCLEGKTCDCQ